jgi:error-prone DNA polymerase
MRMVKGLANEHAARILAARLEGPFTSVEDVWRRSGVPVAALERLAEADAFASLGLDRRQALWRVRGLGETALPLFAAIEAQAGEPEVMLRPMTEGREVVEDYRSIQLSLRAHPLAFLRAGLDERGFVPCLQLARIKDGRRVQLSGIVLIRQRPGTTNVTFITIEDETGIANIILWQRRFEAQRRIVMGAPMIGVTGIVQREGEVIHVIGERLEDQTGLLHAVGQMDFAHRTGPGDGARNGGYDPREKQKEAVRARDLFHPPFRHGPQARPDEDAPRPKVRNSFEPAFRAKPYEPDAERPAIKVKSRDFH